MKKYLKGFSIWLGLSLLMTIYWIISLMIANTIFLSNIMEGASGESASSSDYWLLITCFINTAAVLLFIYHTRISGLKLIVILFLTIFGIQFFMSQIETVWFNDSLKMETNTILMIVTGGALMSLLFSLTATWLTGKFRADQEQPIHATELKQRSMWRYILLLAAVLWPLVYFLAGYFIAWQFPEIREYYSGSTTMESFFEMMKVNITSGLYFFQIFRGFLWVMIALMVFKTMEGSWLRKGLILGFLFSCLGCSQLLLPNPIMPEMVRLGHLLETSTSNFIWGIIIAWVLKDFITIGTPSTKQSKITKHSIA